MSLLKLPKFLIVPDSNVLYAKEIGACVSTSFHTVWDECLGLTELQLIVPEVVVKELVFQKLHAARKATENAKKNLATISAITESKTPPKLRSEAHIKMRCKKRLTSWITGKNGKIVKTPISKIRWSQVVEAAVWRLPPFTEPSDDEHDSEKGFRDLLILESFMEVCRGNTTEAVVFISGDVLLRDAVTRRVKGNDKRLVYDSIKNFQSYLKLLKDNRTKAFASKLLANVKSAFYSATNSSCAYNVLQVPVAIASKLSFSLNFPQEKPSPGTMFANLLKPKLWKPIAEDKYFIGDTNFQSTTQDGRVAWVTRVDVVRMFTAEPDPTNPYLNMFDKERLRVTSVDVKWTSMVSENAELSAFALTDCTLVENQFESPTIERRQRFGFSWSSPFSFIPPVT